MVEGRDESRVHPQEVASFTEDLGIRQLFQFQFVAAPRWLEGCTEGEGRG